LLTIEAAQQSTVTPARAVREPSGKGLEELAPVGSELGHGVDRSFAPELTAAASCHAEPHLGNYPMKRM
jgi:hypothetical protein